MNSSTFARRCKKSFWPFCWAVLALAFGVGANAAGPFGADVRGAQDHPLIKRFTGSWLIGYRSTDWDEVTLPTGPRVNDQKMLETVTLEGKSTRLVYLAPPGKSRLEVFRNYEQALTAAGFQRRFACESNCQDLYFAWSRKLDVVNGFTWAKGSIPQLNSTSTYSPYSALSPEAGRFWYGTLPRGGTDVHVLLYNSVAANGTTDITATTLIIVEPKAMPVGQVTVDAKAMQSGLQVDGKVALYGIFFDTGKAEVKSESKPQLDQMAKLLQADPTLKVFVVGHTDNQGTFDGNQVLSQKRAQAVGAALVSGYKIDPQRIMTKGVANLAPVAANAADAGRARNRRVELVAQ